MTVMMIGGFLIPLVVLVLFLWLTKRALDSKGKEFGGNQSFVFSKTGSKNSKSASNNSNSSAVNDTSDSDDPSKVKVLKRDLSLKSNDLGSKEFSFKKRQIRVMKTILMNITFFFLAWAP